MKIVSIPKEPCGNTKMLIYVHHRDMHAKECFRMAVKQEGIFEAVNLYVQRDSCSKTSIKLFYFLSGSDFIKTSTGKEVENATFPVGIVMMRAIKEYYWQTGYKVVLISSAEINQTGSLRKK